MIGIIKFLFSRYKTFWILKQKGSKLRFHLGRLHYWALWKYKTALRKSKHLFEIINLSTFDILLSLTLISAIYIIPNRIWGVEFRSEQMLDSSFDIILTIIAGLSGVIIGLLYAAMISLGTTVYSKLPLEVKGLLQDEQLGKQFIRFLTFLTFFCVILIVLRFLGFQTSIIAAYIVLLMSGIALFGIVKIGGRFFYFTDPTLLASTLMKRLSDMIEMSKVDHFNWNNSNFQNHYREIAQESIKTLNILKEFASKEEYLSSESLLGLSNETAKTLQKYLIVKRNIPGGSYWYSIKYKHKRWYEISNLSIETYDKIGYLHPEEVKDQLRIEKELISIPLKCLEINFSKWKFNNINLCLNSLDSTIISLIDNNEYSFSYYISDQIESLILTKKDFSDLNDDKALSFLNVIDGLGLIRSNIILAQIKSIKKFSIGNIKAEISKISWVDEKSIYQTNLPYQLHERLKILFDQINYELNIEKMRQTPDWYIENLISQELIQLLKDNFKKTLSNTIKQLNTLKKDYFLESCLKTRLGVLIISAFMDRFLEQLRKLEMLIEFISPIWDELDRVNKIETLKWPSLNIDRMKSQCEAWKGELLEEIIKIGEILSLYDYPDSFPDYSGKFLHYTGNILIQNLINKGELSESIFKSFFSSSITMFNKMLKMENDVPDWIIKNKEYFAVAPIIDLLTISGFVHLISEYYNNPNLWEIVKKSWDEYFNDSNKDKGFKLFELVIKKTNEPFAPIPHREFHRDNWQLQFIEFFKNKIKIKREIPKSIKTFDFQERLIVEHESPLIKVFVSENELGRSIKGLDIFIDFYLLEASLGMDIKFSNRQGVILEKVALEKSNSGEKNENI